MSGAPTILITRPRREAARFAEALREDGWAPLLWPLFEAAPVGGAPEYGRAAAVLLTSANAARAAAPAPKLPAYCVGRATAQAAREAGFGPVESADGDAAALAAVVAASRDPADGPLLFLRGEIVAADLAALLRSRGFAVEERAVYAMRAAGPPDAAIRAALTEDGLSAASFFSPRAAQAFVERAGALGARLPSATALAISAAAAAPLAACGFARTVVAERPDAVAMRAAAARIRAEGRGGLQL